MILMSEVIIIPSDGSSVEEGEIVEYEEGEIIDDDNDDAVPVIVKDKKKDVSPISKNSGLSSSQSGNNFSKPKSHGHDRNNFAYNDDLDSFSADKRKRRGGKVGNNNFRKYRENKFSGTAQKRGARGRKRNHSPYRSFNGKDINRDGDDSNSSYDKKLEEYVKIKTKQKEMERAAAEAAAANDVDMRTMTVSAHPIVPPAFPTEYNKQPDNWAEDVPPDSWTESNGRPGNYHWKEPAEDPQKVLVIESQKDVWKDRPNPPPWIKKTEQWSGAGADKKNGSWERNEVPPMPPTDKPPEQWTEKSSEPWAPPPEFNLPLPPPPPPWQLPLVGPWPWPVPPVWNQPPLPWPPMVPADPSWPQLNGPNLKPDAPNILVQPQEVPAALGNQSGGQQFSNSKSKEDKSNDIEVESNEPLPPGVDAPRRSPKKPSKVAFTIRQPPPVTKTTPAPAFNASLCDEDGSEDGEELQLRIEALRSAVVKRQAKYRECRGRRTTRWNDPDEPLLPVSDLSDSIDSITNIPEETPQAQETPASPDKESPKSPENSVESEISSAAFKDSPASPDQLDNQSDISTSVVIPVSLPETLPLSVEDQNSSSPVSPPLATHEVDAPQPIVSNTSSTVSANKDKKDDKKDLAEEIKENVVPTDKDKLNEEDEEQRLRHLAVLSLKRRKHGNDTDDGNENSAGLVSQEVKVKKKAVISDDDIWNDLYIDENATVNSDEEKDDDDDWDELDEDVLRAELLRGLSRSQPSNKTEGPGEPDKESKDSAPVDKEIQSIPSPAKKDCQNTSKTVSEPKVESKIIAPIKPPVKIPDRKPAGAVRELKLDPRTSAPREPIKGDRGAAMELDRLSKEWSEKMVPRLVVCLESSDTDTESESDLGRSVDKLLFEARQHSETTKDTNVKKSRVQTVKKPIEIAPVTPVAVRHLPEERQKEYMLLKKILAKKERELLAKKGLKTIAKEYQEDKTDSDGSGKFDSKSINSESDDALIIDESKGRSPTDEQIEDDASHANVVANSKLTENSGQSAKNSNLPIKEQIQVQDKDKLSAVVVENVAQCAIKNPSEVKDDLDNKPTSQSDSEQILPQKTDASSNENATSTKAIQVTSSERSPTMKKQLENNEDNIDANKQLNATVKEVHPPQQLPPLMAAASGPLRHRLPGTIVREPTAARVLTKRSSTEDNQNEPGAKRICQSSNSTSDAKDCKSDDGLTPIQRIRSTAILAAELLGKAAAGCEGWSRRELAAQAKVAEAQRQLDEAKKLLTICTASKEVAAKAGKCHYAEALRALRLWQGLNKVKDKERIDMMCLVKRDMQRIYKNIGVELVAKVSTVTLNHENSRLPKPAVKTDPASHKSDAPAVPPTEAVPTIVIPSRVSKRQALKKKRKKQRKRRRNNELVAMSEVKPVIPRTKKSLQPPQPSVVTSNVQLKPGHLIPKTPSTPLNPKVSSPAVTVAIAALSTKGKQDGVWDDPDAVLCPFQLSGTCLDSSCSFKHIPH